MPTQSSHFSWRRLESQADTLLSLNSGWTRPPSQWCQLTAHTPRLCVDLGLTSEAGSLVLSQLAALPGLLHPCSKCLHKVQHPRRHLRPSQRPLEKQWVHPWPSATPHDDRHPWGSQASEASPSEGRGPLQLPARLSSPTAFLSVNWHKAVLTKKHTHNSKFNSTALEYFVPRTSVTHFFLIYLGPVSQAAWFFLIFVLHTEGTWTKVQLHMEAIIRVGVLRNKNKNKTWDVNAGAPTKQPADQYYETWVWLLRKKSGIQEGIPC